MGIVERVDWEDKILTNIRFMRIKVHINLWAPILAGLGLRMEEGSHFLIQYHYERVHKLCNRCGLIGHTRRQCTQCMDDIERMLYGKG